MSDNNYQKYIQPAYFVGLAMMAIGLTLSPFLMSLAQFWLAGIWVIDGIVNKDFKEKWCRFKRNWIAWLLVSLYLLHVVGLIYTSDFQYAFKDLRVKLPLLILPFVLSSMKPLERKQYDLLLNIYVLSVFVATWFSFAHYLRHDYQDVREISHFISHIRFCLQIVFCIFITGYYLFKRQSKWWERLLEIALIVWFCVQIYIFESLSGYVALCASAFVTLYYIFVKSKFGQRWHWAVVALLLCILAFGGLKFYNLLSPLVKTETVDFASLPKRTVQGNLYWHDTVYHTVEDGRYLGLYNCEKELRETWPLRSSLDFDGKTQNGESLKATLMRYLTSKGLHKDAEGVMALTEQDVKNIEQGVANYNNWLHPGARARISSTLFEYNLYKMSNNPNGGSLSQRIEYTRASFYLIKKHPVFGVGTGDIPSAYQQAYKDLNSPLSQEFRHKAHNQYLSIMVGFGIVGLLLFIAVLLLPFCSQKRHRTYLYTIFLCIILLSMLPEDTIETQAGVSFFAFFNALFLLSFPTNEQPEN